MCPLKARVIHPESRGHSEVAARSHRGRREVAEVTKMKLVIIESGTDEAISLSTHVGAASIALTADPGRHWARAGQNPGPVRMMT